MDTLLPRLKGELVMGNVLNQIWNLPWYKVMVVAIVDDWILLIKLIVPIFCLVLIIFVSCLILHVFDKLLK